MLNAYEVELRMTKRATGQRREVTRLEHAHGPHDACVQAIVNAGIDANLAGEDIALLHVGPPAEDIRRVTQQLSQEIAARVAALTGGRDA